MTQYKEFRSFIWLIVFVILYCGFLFLFSQLLVASEKASSFILKPEPGQILLVGLFIIIYYFAFYGLFSFSVISNTSRTISIVLSLVICFSVLYGLYAWYNALINNPFLFKNPSLPWYAKEQNKFFISNSPLIMFVLLVSFQRLSMMLRKRSWTKSFTINNNKRPPCHKQTFFSFSFEKDHVMQLLLI
jgi:Na+/proline symporter